MNAVCYPPPVDFLIFIDILGLFFSTDTLEEFCFELIQHGVENWIKTEERSCQNSTIFCTVLLLL